MRTDAHCGKKKEKERNRPVTHGSLLRVRDAKYSKAASPRQEKSIGKYCKVPHLDEYRMREARPTRRSPRTSFSLIFFFCFLHLGGQNTHLFRQSRLLRYGTPLSCPKRFTNTKKLKTCSVSTDHKVTYVAPT